MVNVIHVVTMDIRLYIANPMEEILNPKTEVWVHLRFNVTNVTILDMYHMIAEASWCGILKKSRKRNYRLEMKESTSTLIGYSMSISFVMANYYIKPQQFIESQKSVEPIKQWNPTKPTN